MSLTYLGSVGLNVMVPGAAGAISVSLPELQARLAGAIAASAQLTVTPPGFTATLAAAATLVATLTAQGSLPALTFQLAAIASLVASLTAQVNALLVINAALGASGGVDAWAYAGEAQGLGPALPNALPSTGGPATAINALVIAAANPTLWASVGVLLKTS